MADPDDPFAAFGDDDSDDDMGQPEDDEQIRIAKSLVEGANNKLEGTPANKDTQLVDSAEEHPVADLSHLNHVKLSWPPPLFKGPIELVSPLQVGGGRGYCASRRVEPGTLLLVEEPLRVWPPEQIGSTLNISSVGHLLEQEKAAEFVRDIEDFHPTKEDVDHHSEEGDNEEQIVKMMKNLREECSETEVSDLVQLAKEKSIENRDSSSLTENDILRLLLALRYNGLESGVYRHVAMLNHSCHPNCAKLLPTGEQTYSEVRATRVIQPGEGLTISYVPHIMSHCSRRRHLWEQHRFDIGANLKGEELKMELIGNSLPSSSVLRWDDESLARRIENACEELRRMLDDIQTDVDSHSESPESWDTLKALEQSSLELYQESTEQLKNDKHILLIPILSVHSETCILLQKAPDLSVATKTGILSRQVLTTMRLLPLQSANLGPDHFDLAGINLDLANAMAELLSRSPKKLYDLHLESLKTFAEWSALESQTRKEHHRIKRMYPHDAESQMKNAVATGIA